MQATAAIPNVPAGRIFDSVGEVLTPIEAVMRFRGWPDVTTGHAWQMLVDAAQKVLDHRGDPWTALQALVGAGVIIAKAEALADGPQGVTPEMWDRAFEAFRASDIVPTSTFCG